MRPTCDRFATTYEDMCRIINRKLKRDIIKQAYKDICRVANKTEAFPDNEVIRQITRVNSRIFNRRLTNLRPIYDQSKENTFINRVKLPLHSVFLTRKQDYSISKRNNPVRIVKSNGINPQRVIARVHCI